MSSDSTLLPQGTLLGKDIPIAAIEAFEDCLHNIARSCDEKPEKIERYALSSAIAAAFNQMQQSEDEEAQRAGSSPAYPNASLCLTCYQTLTERFEIALDQPVQPEPQIRVKECEECGGIKGACVDHGCSAHRCDEHCPFFSTPVQAQPRDDRFAHNL